jgi:hypothetical protein
MMHFKWMVDLVKMPTGRDQEKFLVLAREDLSNYVEGRALKDKTVHSICKFLLEDVICKYGCVGHRIADRGDLDNEKSRSFFRKHGVRLTLTTAYNPEANGKIERGHSPIMKALIKSCDGIFEDWPKLLPYALWADRTTHSSITGFMPSELMFGQKPIMPTEGAVVTWAALPWTEEMVLKDLLALRMRKLERRQEDVERATEVQKAAQWKSKEYFDKFHRLRPQKIEEGDWVLVYDSSLDHQHSSLWKFARRWFGPYIVWKVFENGTYRLQELDGTIILNLFAG